MATYIIDVPELVIPHSKTVGVTRICGAMICKLVAQSFTGE